MPIATIPKKLIRDDDLVVLPRREYEDLQRRAHLRAKDQEWFWTKEWQEKERESDRDIALKKISGPYRTKKKLAAALRSMKR